MTVKSPEEHRQLVQDKVVALQAELDRIFSCIIEDRSYGKSNVGQGGKVDLPLLDRLFDDLLKNVFILHDDVDNPKRKIPKSLGAAIYGSVDVESVTQPFLRILRIRREGVPKQARADARVFEELMSIMDALQARSFKALERILKAVEWGVEGVEAELAEIIKDKFKTCGNWSESVQAAAEFFENFTTQNTGFSGFGIVLSDRVLQSGSAVLGEMTTCLADKVKELLNKGIEIESNGSGKKARYHEAVISDQAKQTEADSRLKQEFTLRINRFIDFGLMALRGNRALPTSLNMHLSTTLISVLFSILESTHKYPVIVQFCSLQVLPALYRHLHRACISFQPAYMAPFLPLALKCFGAAAGIDCGPSGAVCRAALSELDLIIQPRRFAPVQRKVIPIVVEEKEIVVVRREVIVEEPVYVKNIVEIEMTEDVEMAAETEKIELNESVKVTMKHESDNESPEFIQVPIQIINQQPQDSDQQNHKLSSADIPQIVTKSQPEQPKRKLPVQSETDEDDSDLPMIIDTDPDQ